MRGGAYAGSQHRVLYVNRVGFLGGVERVVITLARGMIDLGYRPLLACPDNGELAAVAREDGIDVAAFPFDRMRITPNPLVLAKYPLSWWSSARHILNTASKNQVSLIHVHHPVGALYAIPALRRLGLPLILHVHDAPPVKPLYAMALRLAVHYASRIICVSRAARELVALAGTNLKNVSVIHNGLDRTFIEVVHEASPEVIGPGPHIGVFGVIEPRKGQDVFLRAAERLSVRFPYAHFWIIGPLALGDKIEYKRYLEAIIRKANLGDRVTFTGFRSDVARWMMAMDIVALTSVAHESLGMVLVEAVALGRNVVASNTGGTSEVITDGVNGRLVPPGDHVALADAIDASLRAGVTPYGTQAAADMRERFSPTTFCRRVASLYDEVLMTAPRERD